MNTPIILLHGLGAHTITMLPLEAHLNYAGYKNTHRVEYPVDELKFEECLDFLDSALIKIAHKDQEVILIGQSMGGVMANNLHRRGWKIKLGIYIGSPLHGADLLNQLEAVLPTTVRNFFYKKPYDFLKSKEREEEPPHPYKTISMGWFASEFDGCVYKHESMLNEKHHTHLAWADHRTVFANPRLTFLVKNIIDEHMREDTEPIPSDNEMSEEND